LDLRTYMCMKTFQHWAIAQWPSPWLRHCTDPLAPDLISRSSGYGSSRLDGSFNPDITHFNHGVYTDHNRPVNPNLACFNRSYRPGINNIGFLKTCEECGYTNHKNFNTCQGKGCSRNHKINWKMTKRLFFLCSFLLYPYSTCCNKNKLKGILNDIYITDILDFIFIKILRRILFVQFIFLVFLKKKTLKWKDLAKIITKKSILNN